MVSRISHTTVDCGDAYVLSEWWREVLGYGMLEGDPNLPGHEECMIVGPDGHQVLFIEVPDVKQVKNRIHFDLKPTDRTREDELARLLAHGAQQVEDLRREDGGGWVILADPEGNEFCILRA